MLPGESKWDFEEELVVGVELPEDGEDAFVGEEHLPDGLDPAGALVGGEGVWAELFLEHGLPGVELEDGEHGVFVEVEEGLLRVVPADLLHEHLEGVEAGLLGGVAEVGDGELVFRDCRARRSRWAWRGRGRCPSTWR